MALIHQHYPAGAGEPILVEDYPAASDRLRRNVLAAQQAASAVIEDLTGQAVTGWEEEQDGHGEPYWCAHLRQGDAEINLQTSV